jgi:hypothetical protein
MLNFLVIAAKIMAAIVSGLMRVCKMVAKTWPSDKQPSQDFLWMIDGISLLMEGVSIALFAYGRGPNYSLFFISIGMGIGLIGLYFFFWGEKSEEGTVVFFKWIAFGLILWSFFI